MTNVNEAAVEVLTAGRALLETGWTKAFLAKDSEGRSVHPSDQNACKWCSVGALLRAKFALDKEREDFPYNALTFAEVALYDVINEAEYGVFDAMAITKWNDNDDRTKDEVLAMFDKAIEHVKAKLPPAPFRWKKVSDDHYHQMLDCLPPRVWLGTMFMVGEPYSTRRCRVIGVDDQTYTTFIKIDDGHFECLDPLTTNEARRMSRNDVLSNLVEG